MKFSHWIQPIAILITGIVTIFVWPHTYITGILVGACFGCTFVMSVVNIALRS